MTKTTAGRNLLEMARSRFLFKLVAQKGRCIGERGKHSVAAFWDDWHELDEENLDLLDIDRLIPPDWQSFLAVEAGSASLFSRRSFS